MGRSELAFTLPTNVLEEVLLDFASLALSDPDLTVSDKPDFNPCDLDMTLLEGTSPDETAGVNESPLVVRRWGLFPQPLSDTA
jgi:hypothetical protein